MIKTLEIENFKSIKHLKLDCKKINIFIGEPNTGKSNILETLGIVSFGIYSNPHEENERNSFRVHMASGVEWPPVVYDISDFIRVERTSNLFYDEDINENIKINLDNIKLEVSFVNGAFRGECSEAKKVIFEFSLGHIGKGSLSRRRALFLKFYRFALMENFKRKESEFLLPPSGENLLAVLLKHEELKSVSSQIFSPYGLSLGLKPREDKIEVFKKDNDVFIFYPYPLISDTLQRIIFYLAAIYSNKDSVLAFEEPESHAFPYYTKYLAEIIAQNENNNQYFISTHNPYLLLSILEKSPKDDVGIFITYFEDYQTKAKPLSEAQMQEIIDMEIDVFFNIKRFLEKR